ncbi:MAG: hypothetical protein MI923_11755 [Phycisphaerales bacterium]|nr:hypothetical protein [Phycisphaerales bacterium]
MERVFVSLVGFLLCTPLMADEIRFFSQSVEAGVSNPTEEAPCLFDEGCYLAVEEEKKLEPSGLVWDPKLNLAICVNDSGNNARDKYWPGYEIFAFNPYDKKHPIEVKPLLAKGEGTRLELRDLEGLTRTDHGFYYAIASMSLDEDESRNHWGRHQVIQFKVEKKTEKEFHIVNVKRLEVWRANVCEWMSLNDAESWPDESCRKLAERGGLNVEGLASVHPKMEEDDKRKLCDLVIGLRGPLHYLTPTFPLALVAFVPIDEDNPTAPPPLKVKWKALGVAELPGSWNERRRGIRAIERIPGRDHYYVVVLGHEGSEHHNLRLALWDSKTERIQDRGELPPGFVAEGAAVMGKKEDGKNDYINVLLVDDRLARVLIKKIRNWEDSP